MSAAPRMSLTLETCLILPDTPSAHTHSHRKTHNFTHLYECKHLQIYPPAFCFLFHTGVHLDTEHLTASGAVTSRKTTDTTKSRCCVASRREQVQRLCCLCETEGAERRPDKATHPDTHTHTHTHTHTPELGEDQTQMYSTLSLIHTSERFSVYIHYIYSFVLEELRNNTHTCYSWINWAQWVLWAKC